MNPKIVVVGSSNTDMVVKANSLPSPGETILGGDFVMAAGGKGANQAVAAARSGADVVFVARVGNDIFGEQSLANFRQDRIRTEFIGRDNHAPSGVALIMVDKDGENMISVASGANAKLTVEDVDSAALEFASAKAVLLQLEVPLDTVARAAELGRRNNKVVILNPAPGRQLDSSLLQNCSILTPNETETEILTGIFPGDPEKAKAAADALHRKGVETVIITRGSSGVLVSFQGQSYSIPAHKVKAVDTTAAGDAFNGALCCAIAEGKDLLESVRFASAAAALSVTKMGAQPSLPKRSEIEDFLRSQDR